jgi:hypothetical protein
MKVRGASIVICKKLIIRFSGVVCFLGAVWHAQAMNLVHPYDLIVRAEHTPFYALQVIGIGQGSVGHAKCYNEHGCRVNVLNMWNDDQDALAMLDGFDDDTAIGQRRILVNANDDGVRGHYRVHGDFSAAGFAFSGRWALPHYFAISAHLPVYHMRLHNVQWCNETKDITADDARTRTYLTDDFCNNVYSLGQGLELGGWKRTGLGDLTLFGEWCQDFPQDKEMLKNVRVNARAGLGFPTGKCCDEDKIFALPFGSDGAMSAIVGVGLDLTFGTHVRGGLDVELTHIFSNTRCRRIKTDPNQTELLLLAKTRVLKSFGLTQQFMLYIETCNWWDRFSMKFGYQYCTHDDDSLHIFDQLYSDHVANSANSVQGWTTHNGFFSVTYNPLCEDKDECRVHPYVSLFAKIPFNGKLSAQVNDIGAVVGIDF